MLYAVVAFVAALAGGAVAQFAVTRGIGHRVSELRNALKMDAPLPAAKRRRWLPLPKHIDAALIEVSRLVADRHGDVRQAAKQSREVALGLYRRVQTMLLRLLHSIEALESDPANQRILPKLFALDHLAAMTQRVNSNAMVLAGVSTARQITTRMTASDVLFAALSGIEQYQRVLVEPQTTATLPGPVAHDLLQIVAELIDNAVTFSKPDTMVRLYACQSHDGSVVVGVHDFGVGVPPAIRDEMNQYLAGALEEAKLGTRRVGLQVIRRLGKRHGVIVQFLHDPQRTGTVVEVTIPSAVVNGARVTEPNVPSATKPVVTSEQQTSLPAAPPATATAANGRTPAYAARHDSRAGNSSRREELPMRLPRRDVGAYWRQPELSAPQPVKLSDDLLGRQAGDQDQEAGTGASWRRRRRGSLWFISRPDDVPSRWTSQADEGWKIVETAAEIEAPVDATSGLPMRTPGALLMPGSVAPAPYGPSAGPPADDQGVQEPVVIRNRLASYRDGVHRARTFAEGEDLLAASTKWSLSRSR